jgi:hypothetical protein
MIVSRCSGGKVASCQIIDALFEPRTRASVGNAALNSFA